MMNILYVWFPASWGPSVVEAIQTRNVTCLAKKPIVRDPHIFDRKEAARGSPAREVTCRILFFWLVAAWVKSRAERPSVSGVNRQLHVQIGCKLGIRNRKDELTKQAKRNKLQIKPKGN